jgi:Ca2+-transporting ATPase
MTPAILLDGQTHLGYVDQGRSTAGSDLTDWHRITIAETLSQTGTPSRDGLSGDEAARRLAEQGFNELVDSGAKSPWRILAEQFTSLLIVILVVAAIASAILGDYEDAIAIVAIIMLNAVLGFRQEYRAEKTMLALRKLATPVVRVMRGGQVEEILARELVVGDVVLLEAGNLVPADCRLIESMSLRVQESALTGESEPVEKMVDALPQPELPLADRLNMVFMGTAASYGRAGAVVVATGMDTELGRIAGMLQSVTREATPLQKRLSQLGRWLALAALVLVAIIFAEGLIQGEGVRIMLLTAVSMAVAAVPEGLPAIVTIALALGAQRMLRRQALIRKLPAVETLGSVTVICSDKTGTLTENRMTVVILDAAGHEVDLVEAVERGHLAPLAVSEAGQSAPLLRDKPAVALLVAGGALCNDSLLVTASVGQEGGAAGKELRSLGDPTEGALVMAAAQLGLFKADLESHYPRVAEIPFDSERKLMTTVHALPMEPMAGLEGLSDCLHCDPNLSFVSFTKGALDSILAISTAVWDGEKATPLDQSVRARVEAANTRMAERGTRVLGLAFRLLDDEQRAGDPGDWEEEVIFVGLVGMIDPARAEARDAVLTARAAGIRPVMITGDHPLTATSIAIQVGIVTQAESEAEGFRVLTSADLERLTLAELEQIVGDVSVFARVAPEQKLKIVQALQDTGQIVAMTGDGVNDAPALRKANIGVAMGITGTDVAKEAADIVLLDDNFATIVAAVKEGRAIYDNIRKFIKYLMATNVGELAVMLAAPFLGMPLPLLPLQILWMNLVTDGLPALALGFEPPESDVMRRPPYRPGESIFARGLGTHILWAGPLMGLVALMTGFVLWRAGDDTWQTMLFTVMTISQMFHVMAIHSDRASVFTEGPYSNRALFWAVTATLVLQVALIYVPFMQGLFETQALDVWHILIAVALSSVIFWVIEIQKWVLRRRERATGTAPKV